jgi:hypothetical protein
MLTATMASPKQRRFREESDRRFGKLYSYVDEKVRMDFQYKEIEL